MLSEGSLPVDVELWMHTHECATDLVHQVLTESGILHSTLRWISCCLRVLAIEVSVVSRVNFEVTLSFAASQDYQVASIS